jgi:hypothetical protein
MQYTFLLLLPPAMVESGVDNNKNTHPTKTGGNNKNKTKKLHTCPTLDICVLFHVLLSTRMVLLAMAVI